MLSFYLKPRLSSVALRFLFELLLATVTTTDVWVRCTMTVDVNNKHHLI
jgi:hypothetical protein